MEDARTWMQWDRILDMEEGGRSHEKVLESLLDDVENA
jgi:hypothetical protein